MADNLNPAPPMDEAKAKRNRERMSISNLAPSAHKHDDNVKPPQSADGLSGFEAANEQHRAELRYSQPYQSMSDQETQHWSYMTTSDRQRRDSGYAPSYQSISEQPRYSPSVPPIAEHSPSTSFYVTATDQRGGEPEYGRSHRPIQARPVLSTQHAVIGERHGGALTPNSFVQSTQAQPSNMPWLGEVVTQGHRREALDQPHVTSSFTLPPRADFHTQPYHPHIQGQTVVYPIIATSTNNAPKSGQRKPRKRPEKPRGPQPAYSDEQRFYLMFARITLDLSWPEIMAKFSMLWGPRTRGGLTAMYYRTRDAWGMPEVLRAGEHAWNNDHQAVDARAPNFSTAYLKLIGYLE